MADDGIAAMIRAALDDAARVKAALSAACAEPLREAVDMCVAALRAGGCIWFIGNGGSAADAQHFAAELEGRFRRDRRPYRAMALSVNSSTLTAVGNDLGFENVFARQVEAHVQKGDILVAISTSGRSPNILRAAEAARRQGAWVIAMTGRSGGALAGLAHIALCAPADETPRIQECHTTLGHVLCQAVEDVMSGE